MVRRNPAERPRSRAITLAALAVAGVAFLAALAGIPGRATYGAQVSADEPHYLLTAMSLGEDGGLDVSDEVAAGRYRDFHRVDLLQQAAIRPDGSRIVPHDPLLPLLLALPMRIGGWVAAKVALAIVAGALSGTVLWTAVRRFAVPLRTAAATTAVFAASAPLAVYGHQVYPELPAALATTLGVAALTGRMGARGQVLLGTAVVVLPWLAVKYVPVAAVLAVLGLVRLGSADGHARGALLHPAGRRAVITFAGAMGLAGIAYVAAHLAWYGGVTVYASGDFFQANGGQMSVVGTEPNYIGRSRRLLGLLVGRTFGMAAWQPAWLLMVPAVAALSRRRPYGWSALALPFVVAWLVATFVAVTMQGWWFPGRQVVVAAPLAVIAIAWWAGEAGVSERVRRRRLACTVGLGALGVWSYGWLAAQAATGELTWIVDFFEIADPWYRAWSLLLPDYLDVTRATWIRHGCWLVVLAGVATWSRRRAGRGQPVEGGATGDASYRR